MSLPSARYTLVWRSENVEHKRMLSTLLAPFVAETIVDPDRQFNGDHAIFVEYFANTLNPQLFEGFRGKDVFLVDMSDENYEFVPALYTCFRGVIRAHWSEIFRPETVFCIPVGPSDSSVAPPPALPASSREFAWSFIGQMNKSTRPDAARAFASIEPHLLFTTDNVPGISMWNRTLAQAPRRYSPDRNSEVLAQTIFSLCPMGNTNLESSRPYESLEYGCIPIVERRPGFDYFTGLLGENPLPKFNSWPEAAAFASGLLAKPEELDALQQRCISWWAAYKAEREQRLAKFLTTRSNDVRPTTEDSFVTPAYRKRYFVERELLRHHNLRALYRRVALMVKRKLSGRGMRVHSGSQWK
ncbi:glycosyltransferase family 47 protein [Granulicella cerasi]|uniref:Glycosyltransferase family 47 protein n=1 Tax=Granulicella cerasi TaxID=741063 RepID=A0ABW1ZDB1_9BACT|nr:glycosyltransferase family 47 protein [Granulicella cerasi]